MRVEGVSLELGETQKLELGLAKRPAGMEGGREPAGVGVGEVPGGGRQKMLGVGLLQAGWA